jgi:hypothetical protein
MNSFKPEKTCAALRFGSNPPAIIYGRVATGAQGTGSGRIPAGRSARVQVVRLCKLQLGSELLIINYLYIINYD